MKINSYNKSFVKQFDQEKQRLQNILDDVIIEHVGSTAVGIGGKNIIDILIMVNNHQQMQEVADRLVKHGYFFGSNHYDNRIFMASSLNETKQGDFHLHICSKDDQTCSDFIILRDFLRNNPKEAKKYFNYKKLIANQTQDREQYKVIKSEYVNKLLIKARKSINES